MIIREESFLREKFGIRKISNKILYRLRSIPANDRVKFLGIPLFDPLSNIMV